MVGYSSVIEIKESVMDFEECNKQWLADDLPFAFAFAFEVEEDKEVVVNVPPLKRKLHDDFGG